MIKVNKFRLEETLCKNSSTKIEEILKLFKRETGNFAKQYIWGQLQDNSKLW